MAVAGFAVVGLGLASSAAAPPAQATETSITGTQTLPASFSVPAGKNVTVHDATITLKGRLRVSGHLTIRDSTIITAGDGLQLDGGTVRMSHVTIKGPVGGTGMGDMVTLTGGSFTGDRVTVIGGHCAFHADGGASGIGTFRLTNATVRSSVYGFMLLGGAPRGTKTVTGLSVIDSDYGIQSAGDHAPYTFSKVSFQRVRTPQEISDASGVRLLP